MMSNANAPKGQNVANRGEKRENSGCREKKTLSIHLPLPRAAAGKSPTARNLHIAQNFIYQSYKFHILFEILTYCTIAKLVTDSLTYRVLLSIQV